MLMWNESEGTNAAVTIKTTGHRSMFINYFWDKKEAARLTGELLELIEF